MAIEIVSSEVTQHRIKFVINGNGFIALLSKRNSKWVLVKFEGPDLSVSELIDVCNIIYDEGIIDANTSLDINYSQNEKPISIKNKSDVTSAIIKSIKVTMHKADKRRMINK